MSAWAGTARCIVGLHDWRQRTEETETLILTLEHCGRPDCLEPERIVNLERKRSSACSCRRYGFPSPSCPMHGLEVVA